MLDFTSALYLGMEHASESLRPWRQLTSGVPAALDEPPEADLLAHKLAHLQGFEAAILATSTLHLAWDLFGLLAGKSVTFFMDANVYPIARWGVQCAVMRGASVRAFRHHDAAALARALAAEPAGQTPVVVTDGFCPHCACVAPLAAYQALAQARDGRLVLDDTQALGILGHTPTVENPYGRSGGGSCRWAGLKPADTLVFSSLAKGFGAPLAVLAGSRTAIAEFEGKSLTRVHCSPPSTASLRAAERALVLNRQQGEALRRRLLESVRQFRHGGVGGTRSMFPVQTISSRAGEPAAKLHRRLRERGVRTVLHRAHDGSGRVSFLLTARHTPEAIDAGVSALRAAMRPLPFNPKQKETHHEKSIHL